MFRNVMIKANLAALSLGVMVGAAACNIDWAYRNRQLHEEQTPAKYVARLQNVDPAAEGVDIVVADAGEVDLVEALVGHREEYHRRLRELKDYYVSHGYATKAAWADLELGGLRHVRTFRYLFDAEIPSVALSSAESISEADALYERARSLMRRGGHGLRVVHRRDLMIEAAELFRKLIERYPTSDKIDDAAFYCGEIHKEYLPGLDAIAVRWYERAWTWNPDTPHPARFEAAVVYDYRLHDRDRALELYHSVVSRETRHKGNVRFANRRIHKLTQPDRSASASDR